MAFARILRHLKKVTATQRLAYGFVRPAYSCSSPSLAISSDVALLKPETNSMLGRRASVRHPARDRTWHDRLTGRLADFDPTDHGLVSVRLDADDFEWKIPAHHRVRIE